MGSTHRVLSSLLVVQQKRTGPGASPDRASSGPNVALMQKVALPKESASEPDGFAKAMPAQPISRFLSSPLA